MHACWCCCCLCVHESFEYQIKPQSRTHPKLSSYQFAFAARLASCRLLECQPHSLPPCLLHFVTRDRRRRVLACVPLCRCIIRESICAPFHPKKKPIFFFNICLFLGHSRRRRMAARFSRLTQQIDRRENRRKTLNLKEDAVHTIESSAWYSGL